jgi:hypothetical protein
MARVLDEAADWTDTGDQPSVTSISSGARDVSAARNVEDRGASQASPAKRETRGREQGVR